MNNGLLVPRQGEQTYVLSVVMDSETKRALDRGDTVNIRRRRRYRSYLDRVWDEIERDERT